MNKEEQLELKLKSAKEQNKKSISEFMKLCDELLEKIRDKREVIQKNDILL